MRSHLLTFAILCLALTATTPAAALTLKIGSLSPEGSVWTKIWRDAGDKIEAETDGRIKFKLYPGGVMGNDEAVLRRMRAGQLQGGAITTGSLANIYPNIVAYGLPFQFQTLDEVDAVRKEIDPILLKGVEDNGFKIFGLIEGGFAYLMSQNPEKQMADLADNKVWVPEGDAMVSEVMKALNIRPIPLSIADVLPGLQTGLVDTVLNTPIGALALQWHTGVRYYTNQPLAYITAAMIIDEKAFNRISDSDQKIVRRLLEEASAELNTRNRTDNAKALEALQSQGIGKVDIITNQAWEEAKVKALAVAQKVSRTDPELVDKMQSIITEVRQ